MSHHADGRQGKIQELRRRAMRPAAFLTGLLTTAGFAAGFAISAQGAAAPRAITTSNMGFTALPPSCIADTRMASAGPACAPDNGKTLTPGGTLTIDVPSSVPAGAGAVVVSVDVIHPTGAGFASVFPAGESFNASNPTANVNFVPGQTVDNIVTTGLGTDSSTGNSAFTIYDGPATGTGGNFDVEVDLFGYYQTNGGSAYTGITPVRADETRSAAADCGTTGTASCASAGKTLGSGSNAESVNMQVAGVDGVPSNATAVSINLALTNVSGGTSAAPNFVEAFPTGQTQPLVANQNYVAGETLSTQVVVGVGSGGDITIANNAGVADVIVDIDGYYSSTGSDLNMLSSPTRLTAATGNLVAGGASTSVTLQGAGATAGVTNLAECYEGASTNCPPTVPLSGGNFLTAFPTGAAQPFTANLNYTTGDVSNVLSNGDYATASSSSGVTVANGPASAGHTLVFVDEFGYFAPVSSGVTVSASPSSIAANGTSTSTVTVTVTHNGSPVSGDNLLLTKSGSPTAACGALSATTGTTNAAGTATFTYTSSTTPGTCTITANEADFGQSGSTTITQTSVKNTVTFTPTSGLLAANGTATQTFNVTVDTPGGVPVVGDAVTFTDSGQPAAACGTLTPTSGTTNSSGVVATTYVASTTAGFCTITATEANTGGTGSATVTQTQSPAPSNVPYTTTVTFSNGSNAISLQANGTSSTTVTATVRNSLGTAISGDPVNFTDVGAPTAACGTLSPTSGVTNASGQVTVTYTSSTTAGTCTITATEAADDTSNNGTVTQTALNTVAVAASPSTLPANGTATSTVTTTVTNPAGNPVVGDTVNLGDVGSPNALSCGSLTPLTGTTNAAGQFSATYVASTTSGFCTITATETGTGQSSSTAITQTTSPAPAHTPYHVALTASPSSVTGTGTSSVTATVTNSIGTVVSGDEVMFSTSGSPKAACGSLSASFGSTNASGQVMVTYTGSGTPGTCTITATEAQDGQSGSTAITQTSSMNTVTFTPSSQKLAANGTANQTFTVTVLTPAAAAVPGDTVTLTDSAFPSGACGSLSTTSGSTNASGQMSFVYVTSTTVGICTITATEANTGGTGSATVSQTQTPAPANSPYTVVVTPAAATIAANGTSTQTITATVDNTVPAPVSGDPVKFNLTPSVAGACGTLSSTTGTTNGSGQVIVSYTSSTTPGTCTISATEADTGTTSTSNSVITQSAVANTVTASASPSSVTANGTSTSSVTVTVTNSAGSPVVGDIMTYTLTGSPGAASCGTLSPASGAEATNASGQATYTYVSSTTVGFCTIQFTDTASGGTGTVTITQTS